MSRGAVLLDGDGAAVTSDVLAPARSVANVEMGASDLATLDNDADAEAVTQDAVAPVLSVVRVTESEDGDGAAVTSDVLAPA